MRKMITLSALVGMALAFAFLVVPSVFALPSQELETIYYSDSDHTNEVGGSIRFCNGFVFNYGVVTDYRAKFKGESCSSGGVNSCVACYAYSYSTSGWGRVACGPQFVTGGLPYCPGEPGA